MGGGALFQGERLMLTAYGAAAGRGRNGRRSGPWARNLCLLLFVLVTGLGTEPSRAGTDSREHVSAQVTQVIDGDTFEVRIRGKRVRVRLWGIDTPERQQKFSREAREFTRMRIEGRRVDLLSRAWDKYGRLVAMVKVEGSSLNEELLREGWAWVHIYYCREPICRGWRELEQEARMAGRGLWQQENPVPPWKWKQSHTF